MIKYRVGVQIRKTYDVIDRDEDYFEVAAARPTDAPP